MNKNLIILSPGRRCELIKYFKSGLRKKKIKVFALDMSDNAPALYFADKYFVVKKDFNNLKKYINLIIKICKDRKVGFLLTLIDPELKLLSDYRDKFVKNGIGLILSDNEVIKNTFDKYKFYREYKNILSLVKTYNNYHDVLRAINNNELNFPIIAKPRNGSASINVHRINLNKELKCFKDQKGYVYQQFISGREFGVDVYFDLITGKIVSVFIKEKITMRAGETDKAVSCFREDILNEIMKFQEIGGFKGPLDVDVFVSNRGEVYINEINPRFGGGYPHAYRCGANFIKLIANNIEGKENKPSFNSYLLGIKMLKYNGFLFEKDGKIL